VKTYREIFDELAAPRLVGCAHHTRVRELLRRELSRRGFRVLEHAFTLVTPGRLAGPMYAGGALIWATVGVVLVGSATRLAAAGAGLAALLVVALVLQARGKRAVVAGLNLIGVRPQSRVTVWLAAHYDSKGQPISMLERLGAVAVAVVGAVGLATIGAARLRGVAWSPAWDLPFAVLALVGGALLLQNRATNTSPGAVDNATALVAVLAILDLLPPDAPIGVVFPDAEEYGLLGARALARERANLFQGTAVLNLDGIDDRGAVRCVAHRAGPTIDAVAAALGARRARLLPVVVDGLALAPVARECATFMRGGWRTAALVHTPRDTAARLTLAGVGEVAEAIAGALRPR
jgi:hypothetical protein